MTNFGLSVESFFGLCFCVLWCVGGGIGFFAHPPLFAPFSPPLNGVFPRHTPTLPLPPLVLVTYPAIRLHAPLESAGSPCLLGTRVLETAIQEEFFLRRAATATLRPPLLMASQLACLAPSSKVPLPMGQPTNFFAGFPVLTREDINSVGSKPQAALGVSLSQVAPQNAVELLQLTPRCVRRDARSVKVSQRTEGATADDNVAPGRPGQRPARLLKHVCRVRPNVLRLEFSKPAAVVDSSV